MSVIRRATPAFWVASLALLVSLSGASFAAGGLITSGDIKNGTIKTKDLNAATITALKGATGPTGPAGPAGPAGPTGVAGSAKAYAVVVPGTTPSVVAAQSKGIASITHAATGDYCITLTDPALTATNIAPLVGVDWSSSAGSSLNAYARLAVAGCPTGADLEVKTFTFTSTTESAASDGVGFLVVVP